jgi:hypothetical protein
MNTCRHLTLSLLVLSLLTLSAATAAAQLVLIHNVSINYTNNQISITGSGFEPHKTPPTVSFNGSVSLTVLSSTNSLVVAQLPTTAPGTYELRVTNGEGLLEVFDVTYGALGPQGPIGLTGATGATGATGPTGATGAAGTAGPGGPAGPQGPIGAAGATGAQGPAGPAGANGAAGTGFNFTQAWSLATNYNPYDVATYNGSTYEATTAISSGGNPPNANSSWALMAAGLTFSGNFVLGTSYSLNNVVLDANGSSYVAIQSNGGATDPSSDTVNWALMVASGAQGPIGLTGATGAPGPAGPTGATGAQGTAGLNGGPGAQGPSGATGPIGATGATGPAGPSGPTGPAGPAGPAGPTGPSGTQGIFGSNNVNFIVGGGSGAECTLGSITLNVAVSYPSNYLPADGSILSITAYEALFSLIGVNYGGNGTTTFALPNLKSAAPNNTQYLICAVGIFP